MPWLRYLNCSGTQGYFLTISTSHRSLENPLLMPETEKLCYQRSLTGFSLWPNNRTIFLSFSEPGQMLFMANSHAARQGQQRHYPRSPHLPLSNVRWNYQFLAIKSKREQVGHCVPQTPQCLLFIPPTCNICCTLWCCSHNDA